MIKYKKQLLRYLRVLAGGKSYPGSFLASIRKLNDLFDDVDLVVEAGVISAEERSAIVSVLDELDAVANRPCGTERFLDDSFPSAPLWEPTKLAAQHAAGLLQAEP